MKDNIEKFLETLTRYYDCDEEYDDKKELINDVKVALDAYIDNRVEKALKDKYKQEHK